MGIVLEELGSPEVYSDLADTAMAQVERTLTALQHLFTGCSPLGVGDLGGMPIEAGGAEDIEARIKGNIIGRSCPRPSEESLLARGKLPASPIAIFGAYWIAAAAPLNDSVFKFIVPPPLINGSCVMILDPPP